MKTKDTIRSTLWLLHVFFSTVIYLVFYFCYFHRAMHAFCFEKDCWPIFIPRKI